MASEKYLVICWIEEMEDFQHASLKQYDTKEEAQEVADSFEPEYRGRVITFDESMRIGERMRDGLKPYYVEAV